MKSPYEVSWYDLLYRNYTFCLNIVKYLSAINEDFDLRCLLNGEWEEFNPSVDYQGFVVKRKKQRL